MLNRVIKITWLLSIVAILMSIVWFVLASTAAFQRNFDLVSTVLLLMAGVPALLFVAASICTLKTAWMPKSLLLRILLLICIVIVALSFVTLFISNSSIIGWLKESVTKDYLQFTDDTQYEYRLEIVNLFQKNSFARLYIRNVETKEESFIRLDIPTNEMYAISGGEGYVYPEPGIPPVWTKLELTDKKDTYLLSTTEQFDRDNKYVFYIDVSKERAESLSIKQKEQFEQE